MRGRPKLRHLHSAGNLLLFGLQLLLCTGCSLNDAMSSDQWTWLWLVIPSLGFLLAGFPIVFYRRKGQIESWDLRVSPDQPSPRGIVLGTLIAAGGIASTFSIYNLLIEAAGGQKGLNIGLWILGTIVGATLALYLGLRLAEPKTAHSGRSR